MSDSMLKICRAAPVVPVLTVESVASAVALAQALVAGGLTVLEITLRTPAALDAISKVKVEVPEAIVGAGTVRNAKDLDAAVSAGSSFAVSPGATSALLDAADGAPIPMLPGAATVSEAMALNDRGFKVLKLFPAEPVGGVSWLKNVGGPLPQIHFCPTGGIDAEKAPDYLALDNVVCVGGSWVAPTALIRNEAWSEIKKLARTAFLLGKRG